MSNESDIPTHTSHQRHLHYQGDGNRGEGP